MQQRKANSEKIWRVNDTFNKDGNITAMITVVKPWRNKYKEKYALVFLLWYLVSRSSINNTSRNPHQCKISSPLFCVMILWIDSSGVIHYHIFFLLFISHYGGIVLKATFTKYKNISSNTYFFCYFAMGGWTASLLSHLVSRDLYN